MGADGKARCTIHGGAYQVLFQRTPEAPPALAAASDAAGAAADPAANPPPAAPPLSAGLRCVQHPHLPAIRQCQSCGAYVCSTCDFAFPGDLHLCPTCATKPQTELSGKRRTMRAWSFGLAVGATVGMVLVFAGVFQGKARSAAEVEALGGLLMLMILVPAIVGISLGLGATDRRLANPLSLRVAVIWNGLLIGAFLLLCIVGQLRK